MADMSTLKVLVKKATENGEDVTKLIEAASLVVTASTALLKKAKPMLDSIDTDAIAEKAKSGAKVAVQGAGKAGVAVKGAASGAAGAMSGALSKLGDARDGILNDLKEAKSEKELRKAIKEARLAVLENATTKISAADLLKALEKSTDSPMGPISDMPGCFVVATYKKIDLGGDLADYTNAYVGKAENAAEGVLKAMSREGDPDVYADVKYKQNVQVYVFNCLAEDLEERYQSLAQTFADAPEEEADKGDIPEEGAPEKE